MRELGTGWDNRAFVAIDREGAEWALRFPQRQLGADMMELELASLGEVARQLGDVGLQISNPELRGRAGSSYPWSFGGYRLIAGKTACRVDLPLPAARPGARPLARLLARLHGLARSAELERVPSRNLWAAPRWERRRLLFEERLAELEAAARLGGAAGAWLDRWRQLDTRIASSAMQESQSIVHGDLYGRHVCVDDTCMPVGVIDWGDLHWGDAAVDLSLAWSYFEGPARAEFLGVYADESGTELADGVRARAQQRALEYGVLLCHFGVQIEDAAMERLGRTALALALRST